MQIQIIPRPKPTPSSVDAQAVRLEIASRPMRILDFDIENRPLSYLGSDFTTAEVTAIAWAWVGEPDVTVRLLGEADLADILGEFVAAYQQADLVTGHFIRGHDLPMINGALVELGLPMLPERMTQDTKLDFGRTKGISLSQESLSAMRGLDEPKVQMNQFKWRAANRLTPEGLAYVRERAGGDVRQHIALRRELLEKGWLAPPKLWRSGTARQEQYQP